MNRTKLISHLEHVRDDSVYCSLECGCGGRQRFDVCFVPRDCARCRDNYNRMAVFG